MRTNRYVSVVGAFALATTLAACTGDAKDPEPTADSSSSGTSTAPTDGELPPVEALQREIIGEVDDDAWARIEHERFEAAVAACMQAAGFEYTPEEFYSEAESGEDTETLAWARENGYGITTSAEELEEEYVETPNDLYIQSLSDEELEAYWIAYEGELEEEPEGEDIDLESLDEDGDGEIDLGDLEVGEDGEIDLGDLMGDEDEEIDLGDLEEGEDFDLGELDDPGYGGCQGEAYEALSADPLPYDKPEHQDVLTALDEVYAEMSATDEILAAEESWISCMDEKGYPDLESVDDASYIVYDAYDAVWDEVPEDAEDIDPALLEPVTKLELEVATADFECRESVGLQKAYRDAQFEAESAFIAENRDALVAYFEDMGAALKG